MRLRSKALAILFVLITVVGTNDVWHAAGDDWDTRAPVGHDHTAHHERLRTQARTAAPTHCALCHWLQAFRAGWLEQSASQLAAASTTAREFVVLTTFRTIDLRQRSPRGPPASLLPTITG